MSEEPNNGSSGVDLETVATSELITELAKRFPAYIFAFSVVEEGNNLGHQVFYGGNLCACVGLTQLANQTVMHTIHEGLSPTDLENG